MGSNADRLKSRLSDRHQRSERREGHRITELAQFNASCGRADDGYGGAGSGAA